MSVEVGRNFFQEDDPYKMPYEMKTVEPQEPINLQQAAAQIRLKLSRILSNLTREERTLHHEQICRLMEEYDKLSKHNELAAEEITVAIVGCAFGILSAGFDEKGTAGRALSGISTFLYKANDLLQGLNESTKASINAEIKHLELVIQDLNKAFDDSRNVRREMDKMFDDVERTLSEILRKCS